MSARAAILITGTEVLSGRVSDRNGPWLADRLREIGVDLAQITIVGDRPGDMLAALRWHASEGVDLVVTSGGLGPTADDLTAAVVAELCQRELVLDVELEARIAEILRPMATRWPDLDVAAIRESNRKQALVPVGATVLEPIGTAPGLVVTPTGSGPTVVVLPGPPRELQPMWSAATLTPSFRRAIAGATSYRQTMLRLFGIPESEIAATLRLAAQSGIDLGQLEITTCLRRGEIEIVTRYEPGAQAIYLAFERTLRDRHADTLFSDDGSSIDEQVAALLLRDRLSVAVAESCTGGLLAARLTDRAGASAYIRGGVVAYADAAKTTLAGVPGALIESFGAVSTEVAAALAEGARQSLGTAIGIGVTGVAGPDGGTPEKPVGLVHLAVAAGESGGPAQETLTRRLDLGGRRADIRERTTTHAMHLLRRLLRREADGPWRPETSGAGGGRARG